MLWKIPACEVDALRIMKTLQVEKCKDMDAESVPATTISMGMFLTTYLRCPGVAAAASMLSRASRRRRRGDGVASMASRRRELIKTPSPRL